VSLAAQSDRDVGTVAHKPRNPMTNVLEYLAVTRVSHELRSPLTSVLGYLELLEEGEIGPLNHEQRRMLEVMDRNAHRLLSLVDDLLTVARVEAGAFRMHTSRVPFPSIVDRVMQLLAPGIHRRGLRCTVTVEAGIEVEADAEQLERMLANLVSNSMKFTPPGGQIGIAAWTDAGQAVVAVRDTGIGVPVDEQRQLFTRFFRSTISEMFETQGAGLGLFIVQQIVEAHGGTVEAASTPGGGTTITVRFPLRHP
jgi:signal transduction histidine kinase